MTLDILLIISLIPIVGLILYKEENIKLKVGKKKFVIIIFASILLFYPPTISFEPVYAENNIRQVIKISDKILKDVASQDFTIDPPLTNVSKAFVYITMSHDGEALHSDTWKSWELVDVNTLRLKGEDTALGNKQVEFVAYIIEYENDSDLLAQELLGTVTIAGGNPINFTIPTAINTTNSMIVFQGQHHNASDSAIGNEEFDRIRILDSTTWEYAVNNGIDTEPQGDLVSVVDWNQPDISVQRGLVTLTDTSTSVTVSPPTDVDKTRTILMVTYKTGTTTSEEPNDYMVRATLDASVPPDINFTREGTEDDVDIAWSLVTFPADMIKVHYDSATLENEDVKVTIPQVKDFSKTTVISTVGTPFGWGTGSMTDTVAGANDRGQMTITLNNNTEVQFKRKDETGFTTIDFQVIEFFEKDVAENPQGNNTLKQVVKINGQYTSGSLFQDFVISPALSNITKSILFMSMSDSSTNSTDVSDRFKRFSIIDNSTLRIRGSNTPTSSNSAVNFTATIIEFDSTSPILVQTDQIQSPKLSGTAREKIMHNSPINTTNSHIQLNGISKTGDTASVEFGKGEFKRVRILNGTTWGFDEEKSTSKGNLVAVVNIIDWNQNNISVQRGQATLSGTTLSVSPPTDVIRNQTMLLVTHTTSNNEKFDEPAGAGLLAHLDSSSPPDIVLQRVNGTDLPLKVNWELISFPLRTAFIQHGIHNQSAGTSNETSTISRPVDNVTTAFAIGTSGSPYGGYASGKGSLNTIDPMDLLNGAFFAEIMGKITLENTTTVRFERGASVGSWELGFQVIEFQGSFSIVAMETVGGEIETNSTTGNPIPACCNDGVISDPEASFTEEQVQVIHQLIEWFEPENSPLEGMIDDIENNAKALFEIILRMNNGTYGLDANLTESAIFYQDQYLTRANLTEFINNITTDVRTNFGAEP